MKTGAAVFVAISLAGNPLYAWDFVETAQCTVTHSGAEIALTLTFDPATSVYTIALERPDIAWPQSDRFSLRFDGPRPLIIGTDRHEVRDAGRTLSVSDSGFGNVLDGIQFNDAMVALIGDQTVSLSTTGADAAMNAFRACPSTPTS